MNRKVFLTMLVIASVMLLSNLANATDAMHVDPGRQDPWTNCTACHGTDLLGGVVGVACIDCHNDFSFPDPPPTGHHGGDRQDPLNECAACHGEDLMGAPFGDLFALSCFTCHGQLWPDAGPPNCGDGKIQWKQGETCDPPGSICGAFGNPQWQCNDLCQCVFMPGFCGDGKIQWKRGEQCEPFPGLDKCGPGRVCRDCRCVPDVGPQECEPDTCGTFFPGCNPNADCLCFELADSPGVGACVDDAACGQECASTSNCPPGWICITNTCCGFSNCVPAVCTESPGAAAEGQSGPTNAAN